MGNYSQIACLGQKLFRSFGKGAGVRYVVTETLNGKTYTRVLNSEGKILENRVKTIERFNVGDKKVISCAKSDNRADQFVDRVYDNNGNYLGYRKITDYGSEKRVSKSIVDGDEIVKEMRFGITCKKNAIAKDGKYASDYGLEYNDRGLPIPRGLEYSKCNGKSLQEMLSMTGSEARIYGYYPEWSKLDNIAPRFDFEDYVKNMRW